MKFDLKQYSKYIRIELILSILSTLILMTLTYLTDRVDGIMKMLNSIGDQYTSTNYLNISILLGIGIFLWAFNYFFNHSAKFIVSKITQGLFDIGINILRLGGGLLISYPFLHICVDGFTPRLISFWFIGFCAIAESAFFSYVKDTIHEKRNRPFT